MRPPASSSVANVGRSFVIRATKLKSELSEDEEFYWFYVSLHLELMPNAAMSFSDVALVEYHLLDSSFPEPNVRVDNSMNGFEYKFWLYGFIKVSAEIITKTGDVCPLPPTAISWDVTDDEIKRNGKYELSW